MVLALFIAVRCGATDFSDNFMAAGAIAEPETKVVFYTKAIESWKKGTDPPRDFCVAVKNRGTAYFDLGDFPRAIDDFDVASNFAGNGVCCPPDNCAGMIERAKLALRRQEDQDANARGSPPVQQAAPRPTAAPSMAKVELGFKDNNFTRAKRMAAAYQAGDLDRARELKSKWWGAPPDSQGSVRLLLKEIDEAAYRAYLKLKK